MALLQDAGSFNVMIAFIISALGLSAGYFIKEVSNRLPVALSCEWVAQAKEILGIEPCITTSAEFKKNTGLATCLIILATSSVTTFTIYKIGLSIEGLMILLFTWGVIILSLIDIRHHLLPDIIDYPLIWIGLIANDFNLFSTLSDALWGVIGGYGFFWIILSLFKLITKRDGIGHGDLKMLAMLGAWTGWQLLPLTILIASAIGVFSIFGLRLFRKHQENSPIPFGPYLAISGWLTLLWGNQILTQLM